jgi:hypothetical protein
MTRISVRMEKQMRREPTQIAIWALEMFFRESVSGISHLSSPEHSLIFNFKREGIFVRIINMEQQNKKMFTLLVVKLQTRHMIGVIPPSKVIVAAGLLTHTAVNLKQSTGSDQMTNYACSDILQPATDDVVTPCEEMPS